MKYNIGDIFKYKDREIEITTININEPEYKYHCVRSIDPDCTFTEPWETEHTLDRWINELGFTYISISLENKNSKEEIK